MAKLVPRYAKHDLDRLVACIKPVEHWTTEERKKLEEER
jgi:hypothetical protein